MPEESKETTSDATAADSGSQSAAPNLTTSGTTGSESLGDAGKRALEAERTARKEAEHKLKEAEQRAEDAKKSEVEKAQAEVTRAKDEAKELKLENLRLRVGSRKNLPASLVDRLKGDTEEEMLEDADELVKAMGQKGGGFDGGARGGSQADPNDMNALIRRQAGVRH